MTPEQIIEVLQLLLPAVDTSGLDQALPPDLGAALGGPAPVDVGPAMGPASPSAIPGSPSAPALPPDLGGDMMGGDGDLNIPSKPSDSAPLKGLKTPKKSSPSEKKAKKPAPKEEEKKGNITNSGPSPFGR